MAELKTPDEWAKEFDVDILDPDGWRGVWYQDYSLPISEAEFMRRVVRCTIRPSKKLMEALGYWKDRK